MKDVNDVDAAHVAGYAFAVRDYSGIAWRFYRPETQADEDTEWTGQEQQTGNVIMVMIGDDREFVVDPEDVSILDDDAYCRECGQVGCTADGR